MKFFFLQRCNIIEVAVLATISDALPGAKCFFIIIILVYLFSYFFFHLHCLLR